MLVLSEASERLAPSASARDIRASTEAAKLAGCPVYYIPQDFADCEDAEGALWHVPQQNPETPGVWIGYIPDLERYRQIYAAALAKGIRLLNAPDEHQRVQEFDSAYPFLEGLTPRSLILTTVAECADAGKALGLPVFVKGAVQSRKARGWKACVANTLSELEQLTRSLLELDNRSRGRVVVRDLVWLRHTRTSAQGFPLGREYRAFLLNGELIGLGYYWEGDDDLKALSPEEREAICALAVTAARRLAVPYAAVDVGQTEDGRWVVIETGDAQFSGVSQIPLLPLWNRIKKVGIALPPNGLDYPPEPQGERWSEEDLEQLYGRITPADPRALLRFGR